MLGGSEQRREAGAAVEARHAPPVDRAVACDERRRAAVAEEGVVLERGAHRCVTVIAAASGLVRSPAPRQGVARHRGRDAARYADDDTLRCRRRRHAASRPRSSTSPPGPRTAAIRVETPQPATPDAVAACGRELVGQLRHRRARSAARCRRSSCDGIVRTAAHIDHAWIGTHARGVVRATLGRPVRRC